MDDAIVLWLNANYKFDDIPKVELLRSYTNDVYKIDDLNKSYVLKIYGKDWRTLSDIGWEIELLQFLNKKGSFVSEVVSTLDGKFIKEFRNQFVVLFLFASGKKPEKPFTPDLYFLFGQAIGKMHYLSNNFKSKYGRRDIDLSYLIDNPVKLVLSFLDKKDSKIQSLLEVADEIKSKIKEVQNDLDWGPIHGDATLDNLHITKDNKIVLYDFDSGGMGWRASDLQGWAYGKEEYKEKYESFLKGYRTFKKLNKVDVQISPYITIAWEIWGLEVELKNRIIKKGKDEIDKYLDMQIKSIVELYRKLL